MTSNASTSSLFAEFPPVSTEAWRQKIVQDLRGADYEETLVWHTLDGLDVHPFYRSEDVRGIETGMANRPRQPLFRQDISTANPQEANRIAREAATRGATALGFVLASEMQHGISLHYQSDLERLLLGLPLAEVPIHFLGGPDALALFAILRDETRRQGVYPHSLTGSIDFDPIGNFALRGRGDPSAGMNALARLIDGFKDKPKGFNVLAVSAAPYHDAGAAPVQELACVLAAASEYLAALSEREISPEDTLARMQFSVPVGTSYFMEMAKLRALRRLAEKLAAAYRGESDHAAPVVIHAVTSRREMTLYNPHANILRSTTAAAAALLGGCDLLAVRPFDELLGDPSALAYRLARNTPLILMHEAGLLQADDPAAGAYYIEVLTDKLANAAWALFQEIEARGGFVQALRDGFVQQQIEASASQRASEIVHGERVFVGTNRFPDPDEKRLDAASEATASLQDTKPVIKPLRPHRSTEAFEQLRLRTERFAQTTGKCPTVFLLPMGHPAMRSARARFAREFFGAAGFQIIDNLGFDTTEAGVKAALESEADIIVLCSSDTDYTRIAPEAHHLLKNQPTSPLLIVAGNPAKIDLEAEVADGFVHANAPMLELLEDFQRRLGMGS